MGPHSPLVAGSSRLQSGTKLRFVSVQDRFVVLTSRAVGFMFDVNVATVSVPPALRAPYNAMYLFRLTFTAGFPSPNRSYATAATGSRSCHVTPVVFGKSKLRAGATGLGPTLWAGNDTWK